jgi:LuxR family maltose regulon positive regulatory protein
VEVDADDLRFTNEEAARLLREILGVPLSAEQIASLNAHTEGWVVGLKMAALSMRGQKDTQAFISGFTGSQRYVMDYLVEEVLRRQKEDVRDFLLKTSILERMTATLCDFLTGGSRSRDTLAELDRANLFLVPLDDRRQWYRYHHLFAELLRHQLKTGQSAQEEARLHQKASQWYEANGLPDDAIHHALVCSDWERAMRLIYTQSETRIKRAEYNTLFRWFQVIPEESLRTHHRLYGHYANVLTSLGKEDVAETALRYLETASHDDASLQGEIAFFQLQLAELKGDPHIFDLAGRALSLLPASNLAYRARASSILGDAQWGKANPEEGKRLLLDAYEMGRLAGDYWTGANAVAKLGWILWLEGKGTEALDRFRQALDLSDGTPAAASVY